MVTQLHNFEQELKSFISGKQKAENFLALLMSYETARKKDVKLSDIIKILEKQTKTEIGEVFMP